MFIATRCQVVAVAASLLLAINGRLFAGEPTRNKERGRPRGTIAFSSVGVRHWDLYLHRVGHKEPTRLTKQSGLDFNAPFLADYQKIAFMSQPDGGLELSTMNADGSNVSRLTNRFAMDDHPA